MRISKIVMSFFLLASIMTAAFNASADGSCNRRDYVGRYAASNPKAPFQRTNVKPKPAQKASKNKTAK